MFRPNCIVNKWIDIDTKKGKTSFSLIEAYITQVFPRFSSRHLIYHREMRTRQWRKLLAIQFNREWEKKTLTSFSAQKLADVEIIFGIKIKIHGTFKISWFVETLHNEMFWVEKVGKCLSSRSTETPSKALCNETTTNNRNKTLTSAIKFIW